MGACNIVGRGRGCLYVESGLKPASGIVPGPGAAGEYPCRAAGGDQLGRPERDVDAVRRDQHDVVCGR